MNLLERIPTRWLLIGAALACLALWAAPSSAQTTPDPVHGQDLFNNMPNVDGVPNTVFNSCANCHNTVQDRRSKISGGNAFADISFDTALSRLGVQISSQAADKMGQYRALDSDQIADIAAYIADTPKVTAPGLTTSNALAFSASASGVSVTKNVTISHSIATTENLKIVSVTLASGATAFTRSSSCNNVTRMPATTCTFSVTYTPTSVSTESKALTITLQQGSVTFTRPLALQGSVAGVVVTPPPSSNSSDSGGGALGWAWLTGLALATLVLARRRA